MTKHTLIFFAFFIFLFAFPLRVLAEETKIIIDTPKTSSLKVGQEFDTRVRLSTQEPIISTKIYLSFDSSLVEILKIDRESSKFPYWWENGYSVDKGRGFVKLQASTPAPGVKGEVDIVVLKLKKLKSGNVVFKVDPSSLILDSKDKNLLVNKSVTGVASAFIERSAAFIGSDMVAVILSGFVIVAAVLVIFILFRKTKIDAEVN